MQEVNHLDLFLDVLIAEKGVSLNTKNSYEKDLQTLALFYKPNQICDAKENDLHKYIQYLFEKKALSASSVSRHMSALRQFFLFLNEINYRNDNPAINLEFPKQEKTLPKTLSEKEVDLLFKTAYKQACDYESFRTLVFLEILYASGLRVTELITLPYQIFKTGQMFINIVGKGNKERLVPINDKAYESINNYLPFRKEYLEKAGIKNNKYLFPSAKSKKGYITRQRIFQLIKELAKDCGINNENISPHVIRHAFATHLIEHGADLRSVQEILGHESIGTTQIYTHIGEKRLIEVVKKHHPLGKK